MLVVAETVVLAVVVAVAVGPVAVTVSEMVVVTKSPVKVVVSEMLVVARLSCLQSWWLLLKALCHVGVCAGYRLGVSCHDGRS